MFSTLKDASECYQYKPQNIQLQRSLPTQTAQKLRRLTI